MDYPKQFKDIVYKLLLEPTLDNLRAFLQGETGEHNAIDFKQEWIEKDKLAKLMLQRVSWYLKEENKTGDIILSARGTSRDGELIEYISKKLLPYPDNSIRKDVFGKISAKTAATWDLLQLADVCATTMFLTYEIGRYGFCTPCYSEAMKEHLYRRNGTVNSYGIKFFTTEMKPDVQELRQHRICTKNERTPGATTT